MIKPSILLILLATIIPVAIASPQLTSAQTLPPVQIAVKFEPPSRGAPGDRKGSSSRRICPAVAKPLTALIPQSNLGLTLSKHPTFWFYVPYTSDSQAEFILLDENEDEIYKQVFSLKGTPGIINLQLPETISLETGKQYKWQFSYRCNPTNSADDMYVEGAVEVAATENLVNPLLVGKTPQQQLEIYAANGLWFETVTILAQLRRDDVKNSAIATEWVELLQSVDLETLATEPILDCCTPKK
ncbi:MAG: DUF928 domain-containing protein [Crinalium sp.]